METLGEVLVAEHDLDLGESLDDASDVMSMPGQSYFYNNDPQTKQHIHYATGM